jgi:hypothetical protein
VFFSASTRAPATAIALPVYQDDSNIELMGYWVGIINIGPLWKNIKDDYLPGGKELNVIDHEGTEYSILENIITLKYISSFLL